MRAPIALLICLGLVLTGCPDTPTTPATPDVPSADQAPKAPSQPKVPDVVEPPKRTAPTAPDTPDPIAEMAKAIKDKLGFKVCTQYKDDTCLDPTDTFAADVPMIHAVLVSTQVPRDTGVYEIKWICEDSGGVAPPNYVIETTKGDLAEILRKISTHVTVHGQISKPTKGWPKGSYRVEVRLDGKLADTAKFKIN